MRLGVLDVGSNTVHLLLIDGHPGARPEPYASHKTQLQLVQYLDDQGNISDAGRDALTDFVASARDFAVEHGAEDMLAFATSAIRESGNGAEVLAHVHQSTGVQLRELTGEQEASITYFAVRRWQGWGAGRILNFDIGGGSFEISTGVDALPDRAISVPLGAGRLTREFLSEQPPSPAQVKALRKYVREMLQPVADELLAFGTPHMTVGTSKTFRSLARVCGAAPYSAGPHVKREMSLTDVRLWARRMEAMDPVQRADMPGVTVTRAAQILAGAIVAEIAMELFGVESMRVCPWAMREGLILRRLEMLAEGSSTPLDPKTFRASGA